MSVHSTNPTPESEHRRRFALCWTQAQSVVAAYIASGVRDRQHCEDVIQETALAIAEAFDQYDTDKPFLPWAMGVARNKVLQYYRKHNRDKLVFDETLLSQLSERFERQGDTAKHRQVALSTCLEKLAEHAREMIKLRYVQNFGYGKICALDRDPAAGAEFGARVGARRAVPVQHARPCPDPDGSADGKRFCPDPVPNRAIALDRRALRVRAGAG
jgi:RNA polymerase sigma-70 factor (ECF subfamily)